MKRLFVIAFILAVLFLSCVKRSKTTAEPRAFVFSTELLRIDSLMQHSPDSSLQTLLSFRAERGTSFEFNNNYQSLLLSEALYKTYNPQLNRYRCETFQETSLQDAMHYFDSLAVRYPGNDDFVLLSARSHYMNGVGFYENDSVVEACKEYLHTLEIIGNHFDEKQLVGYKAKFMGLTYNRLLDLFSKMFMVEPAINCGKNSLYFCKIEPTSQYGIANSLFIIGQQFHEIDIKDSASYYYKQALQSLPNYDNSRYRDIASALKLLDYQMGGDPDIAVDSLKALIAKTNNYDEKLTRHLTVGYIFYKEVQYDSALIYLEKVYNNNDDVLSKMQAAEYLREIYLNQGDTVKSNRFSKILADNAMKEYNKKAQTSNVNELYQQYLRYQENKKFLREKNLAKKRTALAIIPIAFLLIVTVFMVMRKLGKKRTDMHKEILAKTESSLDEIKMKIEVTKFIDEPICKKILNITKNQQFKSKIDYINYKNFALGNEQLMELRTKVNLHYDNFTIRLKDKFPELTNDDINYCCLYLLGLKDTDVSALMQKEYSTIRYRRSKIKKILKTDKSLTIALYNLNNL